MNKLFSLENQTNSQKFMSIFFEILSISQSSKLIEKILLSLSLFSKQISVSDTIKVRIYLMLIQPMNLG